MQKPAVPGFPPRGNRNMVAHFAWGGGDYMGICAGVCAYWGVCCAYWGLLGQGDFSKGGVAGMAESGDFS